MSEDQQIDNETSRRIEAIYTTPDVIAQRREILKTLALQPGERVLDVGAGPGLLAFDMALAVGPAGKVCGIDVNKDMLALARSRCAELPWAAFQLGDAVRLPYQSGEFDVAVATQVYEYVVDTKSALAELCRVLRPGGRAIILDTDWGSLVWHTADRPRMERILTAWDDHLIDPNLPRTLTQKLIRAGFHLQHHDIIPLLNPRYESNSFSYGLMNQIAAFVVGRRGVTKEEVEAWLGDLTKLGEAGSYFFSLNRYLCLAVKPCIPSEARTGSEHPQHRGQAEQAGNDEALRAEAAKLQIMREEVGRLEAMAKEEAAALEEARREAARLNAAAKEETARLESARQEVAHLQATAKEEASKLDQARQETAQLNAAAKEETAKLESARQEVAQLQVSAKEDASKLEQARQEATQLNVAVKEETAKLESARQEVASLRAAAKQETDKLDMCREEAARVEAAAKQRAAELDMTREEIARLQGAVKQEAAKLEQARQEAARLNVAAKEEAANFELARQEVAGLQAAAKQEAERLETLRREAAAIEVERAAAGQAEAARAEAALLEEERAERIAAAKAEAARLEAARAVAPVVERGRFKARIGEKFKAVTARLQASSGEDPDVDEAARVVVAKLEAKLEAARMAAVKASAAKSDGSQARAAQSADGPNAPKIPPALAKTGTTKPEPFKPESSKQKRERVPAEDPIIWRD